MEEHQAKLPGVRRGIEHYMQGFQLGGPALEALRETLAFCRRQGIRTAMVVMPEGPAFRSWYPPQVWPQARACVEELGREYGSAIIDARDWVGEEGFLDSHHLLAESASAFSARLAHEKIAPLLQHYQAPRPASPLARGRKTKEGDLP
jgi:hypothetical protein